MKWPGHKVNMYHEVTPRIEKNWPMFEYVNESWSQDNAYTPTPYVADSVYEGMSDRDQEFWSNHNKIGHGIRVQVTCYLFTQYSPCAWLPQLY